MCYHLVSMDGFIFGQIINVESIVNLITIIKLHKLICPSTLIEKKKKKEMHPFILESVPERRDVIILSSSSHNEMHSPYMHINSINKNIICHLGIILSILHYL